VNISPESRKSCSSH